MGEKLLHFLNAQTYKNNWFMYRYTTECVIKHMVIREKVTVRDDKTL